MSNTVYIYYDSKLLVSVVMSNFGRATCTVHFIFAPTSQKGIKYKGQLISKYPFGVIVSTKIPTKIFSRISALAFKKRGQIKKSPKSNDF